MTNVMFLVLVVGVVLPIYSTGKISNSAKTRIAGGTEAAPGEFPYQVSIKTRNDGEHWCGGSIIRNDAILTVAHCLKSPSPATDYVVLVGTNQLNSGGTFYDVESFEPHEQYNPLTKRNDIALIKLSRNITFSSKESPVELECGNSDESKGAVLSGWGKTPVPWTYPNHLQKLGLKTLTVLECRKYHPIFRIVDHSQVCTLSEIGKGICLGDSGSPLVANGVLIGIVSWGSRCGNIPIPDVYTRVSYFIGWINNKLKSNFCSI